MPNTIIVETHGAVGLIRLNRPQALNALNAELIAEADAKAEVAIEAEMRAEPAKRGPGRPPKVAPE